MWTILQEKLLWPLTVNVATAAVLFALALLFKPLVYDLFTRPEVRQYPLICFAEAVPGAEPEPGARMVEFYILNLHDQEYGRDELQDVLSLFNPQEDRTLSPDILLTLHARQRRARIASARQDLAFNDGKGELLLEVEDDRRALRIAIGRIAPRALMKVDIAFESLLSLGTGVNRVSDLHVPFDFDELQDRCFTA